RKTSRKCNEDLTQRHGFHGHLRGATEQPAYIAFSPLRLKPALDKTNQRRTGLWTQPMSRPILAVAQHYWRRDDNLDFSETGCQRRHFFGELQAALRQECDVSREALDIDQIVRRDKERRLARTIHQSLDQILAYHRIQATERLIENQQPRAVGQ